MLTVIMCANYRQALDAWYDFIGEHHVDIEYCRRSVLGIKLKDGSEYKFMSELTSTPHLKGLHCNIISLGDFKEKEKCNERQ